MSSHRNPFRKLPHRPSDYGPASAEPTAGGSSFAKPTEDRPAAGDPASAPTPVDQFRGRASRRPIHPREKLLLWLVCTQVVFLPWAFGTMRVWAQVTNAVISTLIFIVALLPRDYTADQTGGERVRVYPWARLVRFPIFWIGAAFLLYGLIGTLNPAWVYTTHGRMWWMTAVKHLTWLPSGVRAPFELWGPWRDLLINTSVWLSVCAVWIGFTRRRSFQALFTTLVANGFVMAVVGMVDELRGNGKVLWLFKNTTGYFVVTIPYKNHAAAYFNLILALAVGLGFWHYARSLRRLDKSSPAGLFLFAAAALGLIVLFSFSRAGTLLMIGFVVLAAVLFIVHQVRLPAAQRSNLTLFMIVLLFGAFVVLGAKSMDIQQVTEKMERLLTTDREVSVEHRALAARATWEMGRANWVGGFGAGSFRFMFPAYQQHYPTIYRQAGTWMHWEHAHNDYAEFFAEYGAIGILIALLALGYALVQYIRSYAWQNQLGLFVGIGLVITLLHSWVDFQFHNPAIQTTWAVLLFGVIRWAQLEELRKG